MAARSPSGHGCGIRRVPGGRRVRRRQGRRRQARQDVHSPPAFAGATAAAAAAAPALQQMRHEQIYDCGCGNGGGWKGGRRLNYLNNDKAIPVTAAPTHTHRPPTTDLRPCSAARSLRILSMVLSSLDSLSSTQHPGESLSNLQLHSVTGATRVMGHSWSLRTQRSAGARAQGHRNGLHLSQLHLAHQRPLRPAAAGAEAQHP